MSDALKDKPVSPVLMLWLGLLLALSVVPHWWNLSPWVIGYFYCIIALRLSVWQKPRNAPSRWLIILLMILAIFLVLTQVSYSESRQFGVALLVSMLGLKLLELKSRRDLYITTFLGYFLLITLFLFSKSMLLTFYVILLTAGYTTILYQANQVGDEFNLIQNSRKTTLMLGGALPIMALLFVLYPRLDGPLWQLNFGRSSGMTGMSDNINLGSISNLSQSFETAFRVDFGEHPIPAVRDRYWRGMLLWQTDGKRWQRGSAPREPRVPFAAIEDPVEYEVIMEASGEKWLFPLDRILSAPRGTALNKDGELANTYRIEQRLTVRLQSSLEVWDLELSSADRQRALQLPNNISARMRQLVNLWRLNAGDDAAVIRQSLNHFNQQPYVYTLRPPLLGSNPTDEFLFNTRRGFCEHYATSFVVLMRLAGIPSRVVIGYQGGEVNPVGGHLVIRQSDAHAWAEVWVKDHGWVRVDPTAAVAPERIESPMIPNLGAEGDPILFGLDDRGMLHTLWKNAGWLTDNLDLQWHHWVIGFNRNRQLSLLKDMGLGSLTEYQIAILAIAGTLSISGLLFLLLMRRNNRKPDPLVACYSRFKQKLRKAGMPVPENMGPLDLSQQAASRFPLQSGEINAIASQYIALRYGSGHSSHVLTSLRRRVRLFQPEPNR